MAFRQLKENNNDNETTQMLLHKQCMKSWGIHRWKS